MASRNRTNCWQSVCFVEAHCLPVENRQAPNTDTWHLPVPMKSAFRATLRLFQTIILYALFVVRFSLIWLQLLCAYIFVSIQWVCDLRATINTFKLLHADTTSAKSFFQCVVLTLLFTRRAEALHNLHHVSQYRRLTCCSLCTLHSSLLIHDSNCSLCNTRAFSLL